MAETFPLKNIQISQDSPVSLDVSTQHCLGATEDWLDISDEEKGITMITQKEKRYSVPLISYREIKDSYFLRAYFTINERDNTTETLLKGHNRIKISYVGHMKQALAKKEDLIFISATRK